MTENIEEYTFYFKVAYTELTNYYRFPSNISVKNFIEIVKRNAIIDLGLENNQFEIVEAGQFNNINGVHAELAPALIPYDETLREIYGDRHNNTAFYLRIIQSNQFHQN